MSLKQKNSFKLPFKVGAKKGKKIAFVASIDLHLWKFHVPYMRMLKILGYKVDCLCADTGFAKKLVAEGFNVIDIPFSRNLKDVFSHFKSLYSLSKLFLRNSYCLVHFHTPIPSFLGRLVLSFFPKSKRPAVIYTAHGFHFYPYGSRWKNKIFILAESIVSKATDVIITINSWDYQMATKFLKAKSIVFIPGVGVDTSTFKLKDWDKVCKDDHLKLGWVGELNKNKAPFEVLKIAEAMLKRGIRFKIFIAGDGPLKTILSKRISESEIKSYVKLLGFVEDMPAFYSGIDALLITSKREGLPVCVLEAMASGLPVFAYRTRGVEDLLSDKEGGVMVEWGDVESLVNCIYRYYIDYPESFKIAGIKAYNKIKYKYSLKEVLPKVAEIYFEFLSDSFRR